jgi:hypothetical protein
VARGRYGKKTPQVAGEKRRYDSKAGFASKSESQNDYSAETLTWPPSESTKRASVPPKSCFVGGMMNLTPLADISS